MSTTRISVSGLTKSYRNVAAVSDLSFEVGEGSVCGLLGPNGSGKTTTFKCLLGHARPSADAVRFDGKALSPKVFEKLAYVPEMPALYEWMSGNDHFEAARRAYRSYDVQRERQLVDLFAIDRKKRVRALSKGQKTAVAIAIAFAIRPEIMVLDEPASGLDPVHQRSVLNLIIEAAAGGATIRSAKKAKLLAHAARAICIVCNGRRNLFLIARLARFPAATVGFEALNIVLSLLIVTVLFALIFKVLPDRPIAWRDVWLGGTVTAVLFVIGKTLLGLYLGRSSFASTYGAAGSVLVLLVWVYYSAQILLFGAEFTKVYARRFGTLKGLDSVNPPAPTKFTETSRRMEPGLKGRP